MQRLLFNNKGLTVIELVIALALLVTVLFLGYSLFFWGITSFDTGTAQADAQQNARLVDEYLKRELRNAVFISAEQPDGKAEEIEVLKLKLEGGHFYKNDMQVTTEGLISDIIIDKKEKAILTFKIKAEADGGEYNFSDQVLLNNLSTGDESLDLDTPLNLAGNEIYYIKP